VRNIDRNHRRAAKKKAKFAGESLNDFAREALRGCEAEQRRNPGPRSIASQRRSDPTMPRQPLATGTTTVNRIDDACC
jgi:hypothetical protein